MTDTNVEFIAKLKVLNPKLTPHGFILLPYLTGLQVKTIENNINKNDELELKKTYYQYVFQPVNRSFFTYRFQKLPVLEDYSHLYQLGLIHYYNYEHISSIILLSTCLEGVLRGLFKKQIGQNTGYKQINDTLEKLKSKIKITSFKERFDLYLDSLKELFTTFFKRIGKQEDIPTNEFNRHVIIHVLKPDSYIMDNAIKLICILDLICEIQSLIVGKEIYNLIPDKFETNKLTVYYNKIFLATKKSKQKDKLNLLKINKNFRIN